MGQSKVSLRKLTIVERLWIWVFLCRSHAWGKPKTLGCVPYPAPFDSQQSCEKCASMRLYDFKSMRPGPCFDLSYNAEGWDGLWLK